MGLVTKPQAMIGAAVVDQMKHAIAEADRAAEAVILVGKRLKAQRVSAMPSYISVAVCANPYLRADRRLSLLVQLVVELASSELVALFCAGEKSKQGLCHPKCEELLSGLIQDGRRVLSESGK